MNRVERSAGAVSNGDEILKLISSAVIRGKLVAAAEKGSVPIAAISAELAQFEGIREAPIVKQFAGLCVKAVLEEEGFEVSQQGVRLNKDPVFTTGSVYKRMTEIEANDDALDRMMRALTRSQAIRAARVLFTQFPELSKTMRTKR